MLNVQILRIPRHRAWRDVPEIDAQEVEDRLLELAVNIADFRSAAAIRAVLDLWPIPLPLLTPRNRATARHAKLVVVRLRVRPWWHRLELAVLLEEFVLLDRHQYRTGLGPFARPDDSACFEQVHNASGPSETDLQLPLQHRG
jgi:hypothetical protein